MCRIGEPSDLSLYKYTDDPNIILRVHQAGFPPEWKDFSGVVYWRITNKLIKTLKKHNIDL
jgi:hypothetical protein|nr:MAG TPA: hypothetical protein [Caudoviricetes sp.]